jgi:2'-5' RNA ligase
VKAGSSVLVGLTHHASYRTDRGGTVPAAASGEDGFMPRLMTWLVPAPGAERDLLAATIGALAAAHAGPVFPPHVTMVPTFDSGTDAAAGTLESVTAGLPPFQVRFPAFGHEQAYFRSLYLRAEPSAPLTALHAAALRAWALRAPPYRPHLSLLYSDLTPERKEPVLAALQIPLPLTVRIDAAELWIDDGHRVTGWRRAVRVPLRG